MAIVIGALAFAAILAVIAVTLLVALAALVEILPPLFDQRGERVGSDGSGLQPERAQKPARNSRVRLTH